MTVRELSRQPLDAALIARVRSTPSGAITRVPGSVDTSLYGAVEVAWYPDRLTITAIGAGSSVTETQLGGEGHDLVVVVRPPSLDELPEGMPGAD